MATLTRGKTFNSGQTVYPDDLHELIDLTTATLSNGEVTTAKLDDNAVTSAKVASLDAAKLTGTIAAARIASASLPLAKLENVTAGRVVVGNSSNVPTATALTGDVTVTDAGVTSIGSARVTAAKLDGVGKDGSGNNLSVGTASAFGVRAWVRFDGTRNAADTGAAADGGTVKILASANVSSVVKTAQGSGRFTINFSPTLPHANYAAIANMNQGNNDTRSDNAGGASCFAHTTTSVQVVCVAGGTTEATPQVVSVVVVY